MVYVPVSTARQCSALRLFACYYLQCCSLLWPFETLLWCWCLTHTGRPLSAIITVMLTMRNYIYTCMHACVYTCMYYMLVHTHTCVYTHTNPRQFLTFHPQSFDNQPRVVPRGHCHHLDANRKSLHVHRKCTVRPGKNPANTGREEMNIKRGSFTKSVRPLCCT
jgi:hypothetical protein